MNIDASNRQNSPLNGFRNEPGVKWKADASKVLEPVKAKDRSVPPKARMGNEREAQSQHDVQMMKTFTTNIIEQLDKRFKIKGAPPPRKRGPVTCYACNEMGHISRNCPKKKPEKRQEEHATATASRRKLDSRKPPKPPKPLLED